MLQRTLPAGFIAPCLPTKTTTLPSGSQWLHEIKHDGFRIIARKNGSPVRLYSRLRNDFTHRFPLIVETLAQLRPRRSPDWLKMKNADAPAASTQRDTVIVMLPTMSPLGGAASPRCRLRSSAMYVPSSAYV